MKRSELFTNCSREMVAVQEEFETHAVECSELAIADEIENDRVESVVAGCTSSSSWCTPHQFHLHNILGARAIGQCVIRHYYATICGLNRTEIPRCTYRSMRLSCIVQ